MLFDILNKNNCAQRLPLIILLHSLALFVILFSGRKEELNILCWPPDRLSAHGYIHRSTGFLNIWTSPRLPRLLLEHVSSLTIVPKKIWIMYFLATLCTLHRIFYTFSTNIGEKLKEKYNCFVSIRFYIIFLLWTYLFAFEALLRRGQFYDHCGQIFIIVYIFLQL